MSAVQSYTTGWHTRVEAEEFVAAQKQDLAADVEYSYVDHDIQYDEDHDLWFARLDYVYSPGKEAA